jgi:hypothetical protein
MTQSPKITEEDLRKMLAGGIIHLKFEKADGTPRQMYATTVSSMMPEEKKPKAPKAQSGDLVHVFDLELKDWRALKASKVQQAEYVPLALWLAIDKKNSEEKEDNASA